MKQRFIKIGQSRKAFTLVEVIVATAIFAFFIGSVIAAIMANAHNGPVNQRRLQAANLAREGVQLVTQIRDTAWMHEKNWADLSDPCFGLNNGQNRRLEYTQEIQGCTYPHWRLQDGIETIPQGVVTFTRKISIADKRIFPTDVSGDLNRGNNSKVITVVVEWTEGGQVKNVTFKKIITDWKNI